ncbi:MAG TPA: polysaccharide deacetylase family protein [Anaerolineales bacterium]
MVSSAHGIIKRAYLDFQASAVVLMYHRVADPVADPFNLCVSPENFNEQLELLRRHYRVLHLEDILPMLQEGKLRSKAVAITFDDGYADNCRTAAVSLGRHGLPATVFVTSGYLDGRREYWWDEVVRLVFESRSDPSHWRLEEINFPSTGTAGMDRGEIVSQLQGFLREQRPDRREAVLVRLANLAGLERVVRESHRPMTAEECAALARGGLMTVGAHTVRHVWLSASPGAEQEYELYESKRVLEDITGAPVRTLAYPYGRRDSVSQKTLGRVRAAGFVLACANERGLVHADSNPYWIPRCIPHNIDGESFAKRMNAFFQDHTSMRMPSGREE